MSSLYVNNLYPLTGSVVSVENVVVYGTASIAFLDVTFQSSSIIYSSGSNQLGDAPNDTQTLYGSVIIPTGSLTITGSAYGNVSALSISSNTASMDLSKGNFFTLQLVSGSNTYINPSNISAGQTINLLVSTTGSATVSWPSSVKQVTGSAYIPTTTTGKDVVTLISFDNTSLYLSNVKNLV
jgi:hypothetical protein